MPTLEELKAELESAEAELHAAQRLHTHHGVIDPAIQDEAMARYRTAADALKNAEAHNG